MWVGGVMATLLFMYFVYAFIKNFCDALEGDE